MFEIKYFHEDVFIDGSIQFDTDKEVSYTDLVAYSTIRECECKTSIKAEKPINVNGDIIYCVSNEHIFNDKAIYHATQEVASYGNEKKLPNPYNCIYTYNNNILDMKTIFETDIKKNSPLGYTDISANLIFRTLNSLSSVNRMLYQAVLSNYELFAMDILVTCYLRFDCIKDSYLKQKRFYGMNDEAVILKLRSYQYNNIKEEIENLFKILLDIELPDYSYLIEAYNFRNDFAHRYYTTKFGEALVVENKTLIEHVRETNKFVYELLEKVIKKVYLPKG